MFLLHVVRSCTVFCFPCDRRFLFWTVGDWNLVLVALGYLRVTFGANVLEGG
jgi:hypothetical protein